MIKQYTKLLLQWQWQALLLVIAMVGFIGLGAKNLTFTNDYRIFFDKTDKHLVAFENLQNTYTKNDNVLIALAPKNGKVFTRETLAAIEDITERAWKTPNSIRVDSLANYQHTESTKDELSVANLYENAKSLSDAELVKIEKIAVNEPLLVHRLISKQAHMSAINIIIEIPTDGDITTILPEVVTHTRKIKAYINQTYPELDVYLTGIAMLNNAFAEASKYDLSNLIPMTFILILLIALLLLRSFNGILATILVISFSIITAMGLAGWIGIQLSPPVMSAPVIILTLAVADGVHILSTWMHQMRQGIDKNTAMIESIRINFSPIFLTSLTTAIGFLSLNFSDAPPFRDLGNIAAIGVMAAFVFSVTLLPAIATLLPSKVKPTKKESIMRSTMIHFADWVIAKQKILFISMISLTIVMVALIPKNELNDIYVEYFDERIPFRTDTEIVVKNMTGVYFIDYSLDSKQTGGISEPEVLAQIDQLSQWLRAQPEVIHVNTIADTFKRLNRNMHGDDENWYRLPESREMAAQYLLLYEMSLPYGLDLNNQIDIDKRSTRLSVTLETISTKEVLAFEQRVDTWMKDNTALIRGMGSSPTIMFAHIGMKNILSMLTGTTIALVLISLILIIALGSVRYGLLSLVPNLIPAGMAFGFWAVFDGEIGLALSVVTAMTLGIVVDDTIHFLSKYIRARREQNLSAEDAIRYAFSTVGVALWVTSIALIGGFLVLATSSFELNAGMGLLTSIVIAFALLTDFLLLPPLLIKLDGWLSQGETKKVTTTESVLPMK
ncbi:MAG: MMPL family transporter [Thiotrichaceae bacterium]|nr:MMPL family transporter [Thiotrichaceae bacterium]